MNLSTLLFRGLAHYRRTHAGVAVGSAIATATLVGALVVGDSVRYSLARQAEARIGRFDSALVSGDRFFGADLAGPMAELMAGASELVPAIRVGAVVSSSDGDRRIHEVHAFGVDEHFFPSSADDVRVPERRAALVNEELARRLDLELGEEIVLRVEKPSALPRDMALAPDDVAVALRVKVTGFVSATSGGDFGLEANPVPPANVFLSLDWFQSELEVDGRANLLLARGASDALDVALGEAWRPGDAELELATLDSGRIELRTSRIFFDEPILAALDPIEGVALDGVFTYFVNELRSGERSTPYSMVAGIGALASIDSGPDGWSSIVPTAAGDDELILNQWTADDLGASIGDEISLSYFVVDPSRQLTERSRSFRVAGVVPIAGLAADRTLMPAFPGLADEENCRDWEPGTPVDLDRIRDKDEDYWDDHRGTPKGFVTLAAGREMWSSRFGALTAVRFDASAEPLVREALDAGIEPRDLGLFFRDLRGPAERSSDSPTDFGGLFIGLSFFLILSAILISTQLFLFGVEQRAKEIGLFTALGFRRRAVQRVFFGEALVVAVLGSTVGALLGLGYTRVVLRGLATIWSDAVSGTVITFHAEPLTVVFGALGSIVAVGVAVALTLRGKLRQSSFRLLMSEGGIDSSGGAAAGARRPRRSARHLVVLGFALSLGVVFAVDPAKGPSAAGAFFGGGALFLASALGACRLLLLSVGSRTDAPMGSIGALAIRNTTRRTGRSIATVTAMAIGTFLVVAIGVNRQGPTPVDSARDSGTGGFALIGRSSLPVVHDLNSPAGREAFGIDTEELEGLQVVPLRVRAGDDASCLSLARAEAPRLVGVDPTDLAERGAFTFASSARATDDPWSMLDDELADDAIPAVADSNSLKWQLHKSIGDTIGYVDERGRPFEVRIVGAIADSILQGDLIISERRFEELYPTAGGYRRFLVDAPEERTEEISAVLSRGLSDVGLALERASARLDAFHAVQNGYLAIFQLLGALGLLLGSVGLGMVVLRNTLERRSELALAAAVGFRRSRIRRLVLSEYGALLAAGLCIGTLAAFVAILPTLRGPSADLSLTHVLLLVAIIAVNGMFWILLASRVATRHSPLSALREE